MMLFYFGIAAYSIIGDIALRVRGCCARSGIGFDLFSVVLALDLGAGISLGTLILRQE